MQGRWTSQDHYSWECVNALCEEHCPGPVHMRRPNSDGASRFMTRTDLLTNRTMFLIGRALDKEHLVLYKLLYSLKQIPRAPTIHGCTNDCLYLSPAFEDEVDGMPAEDHLAKQIEDLIATHERLRFCKDGSPLVRVEKEKSADGAEYC